MKQTMPAYINWGRWVVDCPCGSAREINAMPAEIPCVECGDILLPQYPANYKVIERILAKRPTVKIGAQMIPKNRNWKPGETLVALRRENKENGLD